MIGEQLIWDMLPDGLEGFFEIEDYEKTDEVFRIILLEKNILPPLPEEKRSKRVVNTLIKAKTVDFFPIKGRKGEIILKRRMWQLEGESELVKRDINICAEGTKLEKEFADFLKEMDRE